MRIGMSMRAIVGWRRYLSAIAVLAITHFFLCAFAHVVADLCEFPGGGRRLNKQGDYTCG
jgi:formate/nitrite transporter FocA (FNT family)